MRPLARLKFRTKLNLGITAIVVAMALVLLPLVGRMTAKALVEESKKRGSARAESLSTRAVEPLLAGDFLRLKDMVDEQVLVGDVVYAFVQDSEGHVLAHSYHKGFPIDLIKANSVRDGVHVHIQLLADKKLRIYDFAAPVSVTGKRLGTVRVGLSKTRINASVRELVTALAILFGGGLFLATALATLFARRVTRRLGDLRRHAEEMLKGNLDPDMGSPSGVNCWEMRRCELKDCPAYGETRRRCWYIAGTMCPECPPAAFPCGLDSCRACAVYRENAGDELQDLAETFDVMSLTLKTHIDELRDAETNLRDQQRLMRTLLDGTPDRVSLMDTRMRYQGANRSFAESVGLSLAGIEGKTDFDLFPEKVAEERHLDARDILESGTRIDKQIQIMEGDKERWFHVVCIPIQDDKNHIVGLLRTDRDISDIKQYEAQLIQAQKMEALGQLAGGVAHEINTPLGIILGYVQLLQEDLDPESQIHQDLRTVESQAKVCRKIVADLLGFSRSAASQKREMCFNNSVMEAVRLVAHTFSLDRTEILTELDDRFPIIYGDPEKLKQVWINLLNNARDAMPEDGGTIVVRTELDTPNGKVSIMVADSGSGIAEDTLRKIFDPFFSTKPVGVGTGLGLSVSFGIIEDHGGEITAASPVPTDFRFPERPGAPERGPGTLFEVHLPLDLGTYKRVASQPTEEN
ncbi:ATP-binding protein [Pseudodesulfovibrio tunisiensis]|uniref:ATP-binding protein n=1 Tax=Pseudodesulfovibrio tunisiensis TaxID=463192 RepID=UPI001FB3197D|nr:ATP-binding protein [Pseudodesulfovibrio tunisiensis]